MEVCKLYEKYFTVNRIRRADFEKLTFVFKIIVPAWYCKLSMF
jgi:hypothetical protein